jgi:tetratricopeptide (TPR) repeat protein
MQCFRRGGEALERKPPNLDYAIEMFSLCVVGDAASPAYAQALLGSLRQKFGGKKAGGLASILSGGGGRGLKKFAAAGQWQDLIKQGVTTLKSTPSDQGCLLAMADACGNLGFNDSQRVYLKAALDAAPKDAEVNRQCAAFLAGQGEFDQAIACWVRIRDVKGLRDEAEKEIARLQVEKTIVAGRGLAGRAAPAGSPQAAAKPAAGGSASAESGSSIEPGESAPRPASATPAESSAPASSDAERIAALRRAIAGNPTGIDDYLELADLLERHATVSEAEQVLAQALAASGNDLKVQEHIEDRHIRWSRHRVMLAEKRLAEDASPQNQQLVARLKAEHVKREIDVYAARCARYPENVLWKYELAMRLKASGNHAEAIKHFQGVLQDPRRKGAVALELGECFQKIRQYELAMQNYKAAVDSLTDRETDLRKRALYRAGVLATGLGDTDSGRRYLADVASLDFGYRDVRERLDKLGAATDTLGGGDAAG